MSANASKDILRGFVREILREELSSATHELLDSLDRRLKRVESATQALAKSIDKAEKELAQTSVAYRAAVNRLASLADSYGEDIYDEEPPAWSTSQASGRAKRPMAEAHTVTTRDRAREVACPECGAEAGDWCRTRASNVAKSHKRKRFHIERHLRAVELGAPTLQDLQVESNEARSEQQIQSELGWR